MSITAAHNKARSVHLVADPRPTLKRTCFWRVPIGSLPTATPLEPGRGSFVRVALVVVVVVVVVDDDKQRPGNNWSTGGYRDASSSSSSSKAARDWTRWLIVLIRLRPLGVAAAIGAAAEPRPQPQETKKRHFPPFLLFYFFFCSVQIWFSSFYPSSFASCFLLAVVVFFFSSFFLLLLSLRFGLLCGDDNKRERERERERGRGRLRGMDAAEQLGQQPRTRSLLEPLRGNSTRERTSTPQSRRRGSSEPNRHGDRHPVGHQNSHRCRVVASCLAAVSLHFHRPTRRPWLAPRVAGCFESHSSFRASFSCAVVVCRWVSA